MLRTDHCYPPTQHAPLGPPIVDHHFEALTMPAPLPPTIEPLTPTPEVTFTDDEAEWLWRDQQRARAAWGLGAAADRLVGSAAAAQEVLDRLHPPRKPPRRMPWFGLVVGAALFAVGYLMGRWLP